MLYLHHSNRLESLASLFARQRASHKVGNPFEPEWVVVQNAGMGRWLSLQLARENGIAANLHYLFPAELTWELLRKVLADVPERDPASPKLLRWRLLQAFLQHPERYQQALGHYLRPGQDDSAWQLAQQVAGVFDGYLFFRPDWIREWESQLAPDWQAQLWQAVVGDNHLEHWVRLQGRFIQQLAHTPEDSLPERISFFSVPALSPAYIELVAKVAERVDVHFFVMNPSMQYWGDIESEKRRIKFAPDEQAYIHVGNPLLASWGTQGRDFIENLRNVDPYPAEEEDFFEPEADSMLHIVQADILNLAGDGVLEPWEAYRWEDDPSIRVHACHSPMREVEVLYDQILSALAAGTGLTPADVVVMSPEVNAYAPFIEAVFAGAKVPLPFSIADQRFSQALNISAACIQLLELPQGRFEAESVFALLEYAEIRGHFGLDELQVQQCRDWVRAVNIRWGVDGEFRRQFAQQTTFEHTWMYGLDRLLLGYALPGEALLGGVLPYGELEGSQAQVLERFTQCLHVLFALSKWSSRRLALADWVQQFRSVLEKLFADDAETQAVYQALDRLLDDARQAEFAIKVAWAVFRDALRRQLEQHNQADGFLGHGITFCTLMPMRSVPFRFVALLGMQDGGFPRQDNRLSFDRLAHDKKRKGDRSRRDEDRYLFLESLLSAREYLYISYIGQSVQDNSTVMPSVLVSELLDYLEKRFGLAEGVLVTSHPLQAFSQRYFTDPALFTYAADYARLYTDPADKQVAACFWDADALREPDGSLRQVGLADLVRFYRHPARVFLQQQFDLVLMENDDELVEREPFALEAFADSTIGQQSMQHLEQGGGGEGLQALLRAQGLLPHGKPGELLFEQQFAGVQAVYQQLPQGRQLQNIDVHLALGAFGLRGTLAGVAQDGLQVCHFGYMGVWQWVAIWLQHLALNACGQIPPGWQRVSRVYTVEGSFRLLPVADAEAQLTRLLEGYWQGLQEPLPFFPKSAWKAMEKGTFNPHAWLGEWIGSEHHDGEGSKPEYRLLYRGRQPLVETAGAVQAWAEQVFGCLLAVRQAC